MWTPYLTEPPAEPAKPETLDLTADAKPSESTVGEYVRDGNRVVEKVRPVASFGSPDPVDELKHKPVDFSGHKVDPSFGHSRPAPKPGKRK